MGNEELEALVCDEEIRDSQSGGFKPRELIVIGADHVPHRSVVNHLLNIPAPVVVGGITPIPPSRWDKLQELGRANRQMLENSVFGAATDIDLVNTYGHNLRPLDNHPDGWRAPTSPGPHGSSRKSNAHARAKRREQKASRKRNRK